MRWAIRFAAGHPVGEAHELLARPLADDDLVEEGSVEGVVDRVEGARVDVRDGDETLKPRVIQHGAGDGDGGPAKLMGGLDLVGEEELDVLGQGRALLGRLQLQMQLDERVEVARNDFVGDGIDEGLPSSCDEDEDAGARPLVARVADLEEGFGKGERASARLDVDPLDPLCGLISSGFCGSCDILGRDLGRSLARESGMSGIA